jgi:N-glycosidase YbiA
MNIKKLFIMVILITNISSSYAWYGRVIPIAWDNGQWKILLARDKGTQSWSDFKAQAPGGKKGNAIAADALGHLTNNKITVNPSDLKYYYQQSDGDWVHFVKIPFIPGRTLYSEAQNNLKDNFAWIPLADITAEKPLQTSRGDRVVLANDVKPAIQYLKDNYEDILKALSGSAQDVSQQQGRRPQQQTGVSWFNIPGAIYFYESDKPYFEFTNFARYPIDLDGKVWPTSEHYYQAQKFTQHPALQEQIRKTNAPRDIFNLAQQNKASVDADWQKKSVSVMLKAVRAKFDQHPQLAQLLQNTQTDVLVENAGKNDAFYGAGADGNGQNLLGQILMRVRDELQGTIDSSEDFICYVTPADYFNHTHGKVCAQGTKQSQSIKKPVQKPQYIPDTRQNIQDDNQNALSTLLTSLESKLTDLQNYLDEDFDETGKPNESEEPEAQQEKHESMLARLLRGLENFSG